MTSVHVGLSGLILFLSIVCVVLRCDNLILQNCRPYPFWFRYFGDRVCMAPPYVNVHVLTSFFCNQNIEQTKKKPIYGKTTKIKEHNLEVL